MPDYYSHLKEGRGIERVVLFFCVLFIIIQIGSVFFFSKTSLPKKSKLSVLPKHVLTSVSLADGDDNRDLDRIDWINSQNSFHFAPFFFQPIPINYCNKTLLMSIKGIGPSLAESILQTRNNIGGFSGPEDLLKIHGIGNGRLEIFKSNFSFSKVHDQN